MFARLMPKPPLNVAPWITSGNCAKCRRPVAEYCSAASTPVHGDNGASLIMATGHVP